MVHKAYSTCRVGLGITMAWYWYLTGVVTTICIQSLIANILFAKGWLQVVVRRGEIKVNVYDWDDSKGLKRSA